MKECLVHERLPLTIPEHDYTIMHHNITKEITNICHKVLGNIKYKAVLIEASSGYTLGSTFKIWSALHRPQMVNILHIHLNDSSDSIAIDVKYLQDGEYNQDFKNQVIL
jgi:hypothetical protein